MIITPPRPKNGPKQAFLSWLQRYHVALITALALLPALAKCIVYAYSFPFGSDPISFYYFIGLDTGFGGRKLMGTLCQWVLPNYVEHRHLRLLVITSNALMLGLFVWMTHKSINRNLRESLPLAAMLLVYMLSPFSLANWVDSRLSVGFMETYMMVLTLVWLLLYLRWRGQWHFYLSTLIIAAAGIMIHHSYACLFFPLMVALFIYDTLEENGINWKKGVAYGGICLALLVLFVCIWKFHHMNIDMETLYADIRQRAAPDACEWNKDELHIRYYISQSENRAMAFGHTHRYPELALSMLMLAPIFVVFYWPWVRAYKSSHNWRYLLMPLSITMLVLPSFFMITDYSRLWTAWFFMLILALMTLTALKDHALQTALKDMLQLGKKHWWLATMLLVYAFQLHVLGYDGLREAIEWRRFVANLLGRE